MLRGGPRTIARAAFIAAAVLCAAAGAWAQDASPLTVLARGPDAAEIRIRGVSLKSARSDDAQNTIAFDFNGPVSDEAFARLQEELPDWVEMAYSGYDNAIIRTKRPVTFMTRPEADGFSLRMVPRDGGAAALPVAMRAEQDAPPPERTSPPSARGWRIAEIHLARASAERPFDTALRGGYDTLRVQDASMLAVDGGWRHEHGTMEADARGQFDVNLGVEDLSLVGDVNGVFVNSKGTRQLTGAVTPYNYNDVSGAIGAAMPFDGAVGTAEVLYGRSGVGGRIGLRTTDGGDWLIGMRAAYHEPYLSTAEAVADRAERDYSALFASGQIFDGLWATGEIDATRYGVHADANVARTLGWHAGLRYDIDGWPLALTYDGDGEYVLAAHKYTGLSLTPFVPLSIRTREVHQFGGSFSDQLDDTLWFDLYGGYAIDRYGPDGGYGGAALRVSVAPGFDIALDGRYSAVAERQGEGGNVLSGGLRLTYAWGARDAPIFHGL